MEKDRAIEAREASTKNQLLFDGLRVLRESSGYPRASLEIQPCGRVDYAVYDGKSRIELVSDKGETNESGPWFDYQYQTTLKIAMQDYDTRSLSLIEEPPRLLEVGRELAVSAAG